MSIHPKRKSEELNLRSESQVLYKVTQRNLHYKMNSEASYKQRPTKEQAVRQKWLSHTVATAVKPHSTWPWATKEASLVLKSVFSGKSSKWALHCFRKHGEAWIVPHTSGQLYMSATAMMIGSSCMEAGMRSLACCISMYHPQHFGSMVWAWSAKHATSAPWLMELTPSANKQTCSTISRKVYNTEMSKPLSYSGELYVHKLAMGRTYKHSSCVAPVHRCDFKRALSIRASYSH